LEKSLKKRIARDISFLIEVIMKIKIGMYVIEIVEHFEGKKFWRGKDKTGTVYQFLTEQIVKEIL
jgi:hypothetical protein